MTMKAPTDNLFAELHLDKLPSLPQILLRLVDMCQDGTSSFKQLADLVNQDTAISTRVISLANSTYYGQRGQIDSVERALMLLGTDTIKTIVMTAIVQQFFSGIGNQQSAFLHRFWRHSLTTALLAKSIAQLTSYSSPDEAYLIGLLHNIGELILRVNHAQTFINAPENGTETAKFEYEKFSFTHADVGSWLIDQWGLGFAADAVRFHHEPLARVLDAHHLTKIVYLGSLLADRQTSDSVEAYDAGHQLFGLTAALVNEITLHINAQVEASAEKLNIALDKPENIQAANISLAEKIRDLSLMQTTQNQLLSADNLEHFEQVIQQSVELLFGYRKTLLVPVEPKGNALQYKTLINGKPLHLKAQLDASRSMIAAAALNAEVYLSAHIDVGNVNLSAIDEQFIRLTHSTAMIAVPLYEQSALRGVLILGCTKEDVLTDKRKELLLLFGGQIGKQLAQYYQSTNKADSDKRFLFNKLQLRVREIVHEVNNPLSVMRNYVKVLTSKLENSPEISKELTIIREEIDRAGQLLLQLKDLGTENDDDQGTVDLNDELTQVCNLYNESIFVSHHIDCELKLDKKLQAQSLNRNRFRQIATNLLKNAAEAMPNGGEIRVSTASINVNGKRYCEISIADNGPGIPDTVQDKMFSPQQSTKGEGHSGLGLSITKNLVTGLNGTISCKSDDRGTEFQIRFPLNNAK